MPLQDMLTSLNVEQKKATTWPEKNLLVLAGAGSGKTRVLTTRYAWLMTEKNIHPKNILALTFTNKAAKEMLERIQKSVSLPIQRHSLWVGTFHGLCYRILRQQAKNINLQEGFEIIDTQTQKSIIKKIIQESYPNTSLTPQQVTFYIQKRKQEGQRATSNNIITGIRAQHDIYQAYEKYCKTNHLLDFNELILHTYEMLCNYPSICQEYREKFQSILVDEFQDTDTLQYELIKKIADPQEKSMTHVFAVGDDDQSIYSFRGAKIANIEKFCREFSIPEIVRLEQNYRSQGNILKAANALIKKNRTRLGKNLWTDMGDGDRVNMIPTHNEFQQAVWVAKEIQKIKKSGEEDTQIAILYRTNAQSAQLEHALFSSQISYRVLGHLRFYERTEIKNAIAHLRLVANPHDNFSFLRVSRVPAKGIGDKGIEKLKLAAELDQMSLYQTASMIKGPMQNFARLIESMQGYLQYPLAKMIEKVLETSGLFSYYRQQPDHHERVPNLEALIQAARFYCDEQGMLQSNDINTRLSVLNDFLAYTMMDSLTLDDTQPQGVQLMTVHMAKGLEFNSVFVIGLNQGILPNERTFHDVTQVEEERRLMYVAITRARKKLYLSYYGAPSQFLRDIPVENTQKRYSLSSLE